MSNINNKICNTFNLNHNYEILLEQRQLNFQTLLDLIKERHGKCLSVFNDYKTIYSKLTVECAHHHSFQISLYNIRDHKWCDICRVNLGEDVIIKCLEFMFNKPFTKNKFDWLNNYEKLIVEDLNLDNYNQELNLAVEHCNSKSRNQDFYNIIKTFEYKKQNIKLINISSSIELQTINVYLINECKRLGYRINQRKVFKWTNYIT
jgi:hypothetical protein